MKTKLLRYCSLVVGCWMLDVGCSLPALADDVFLSWQRDPQSIHVGYYVYTARPWQTEWTRAATNDLFTTSFTVTNAAAGQWSFLITSFDRYGNESPPTAPITVHVPYINVQPPVDVRISIIHQNRVPKLPPVPLFTLTP